MLRLCGSGDYTLQLDGATAVNSLPLQVSTSAIAAGTALNVFPETIQLDFSSGLLLPTVDTADLTVNGSPATSVAMIDGRTLVFDIAALETADGMYEIGIASGALESVQGRGNDAYHLIFSLDTTAPVVTGTNVQSGDVLSAGSQQFLLNFSEPLNPTGLGPEDVVLIEHFSGRLLPVDGMFAYDPETDLLVVQWLDLAEGAYSLTLRSGPSGFRDLVDNPLNGAPSFPLPSGQGNSAGDDFVLHFAIDTDSVGYPLPFVPQRPLGSLIYQGTTLARAFHEAGDVDEFTVNVAAGQTITVVLSPVDEAVQAEITLSDPLGASLATVAATAPGRVVIAQTVAAAEAGVYRIQANSLVGAGRYQVQVILNAAAEEEPLLGASNDAIMTAEDLDGASVGLQAGADRLAVLGSVGTGFDISTQLIPLTGDTINYEARALVHVAGNQLLLADGDGLFNLTAEGQVSSHGVMDHWSKGLAFVPSGELYSIDAYDSWLYEIDPNSGETLSSLQIILPGRTVIGGNGLALDPTTGDLWAVLRLSDQSGRELVRIDPYTGLATSIGDLGDRFAAIAFDNQGTLFGATGTGGSSAEALFTLSKQDAAPSFVTSQAAGLGGQAMAFNASDGKLYHATGWSSGLRFQSIQVNWHADSHDIYRFSLAPDQAVTLAVESPHGGALALELLAEDGTLLTAGMRDATNAKAYIADFVAPVAGTYYARIRAAELTPYSLSVTRDATFHLTIAEEIEFGQFIGVTGQVSGHLGSGSLQETAASISLPINLFDRDGFRWDIQGNGNISDGSNDAYDGGLILNGFPSFSSGSLEEGGREVSIGPATVSGLQITRKIYVPTDQGYARFLEVVTNPTGSTVNYTASIRSNLGSDSNTIVVGTSSGDLTFSAEDDWIVSDDSSDGGGDPTLLHVIAGPGGQRPVLASRSGDNLRYDYQLSLAPGETKIVMHFASQNSNRATALAKAPALTALPVDALIGLSDAERAAIVNFTVPLLEQAFWVQASEGDQLTITTSTPGDSGGAPGNMLDVIVDLYDPDGALVASDDNSAGDGRNASLTHTTLTAGAYRVVVRGAGDEAGDYTLRVEGATGVRPFEVTASDPLAGMHLPNFPATYRVQLNQAVLLSSVDASDLSVNGTLATGVTLVDPQTLEFNISAVAEGDGVYVVRMQPGALTSLSGQPLADFTASFVLDTEPPTVISSSIHEGDLLPPGPMTYVVQFSEPMGLEGLGPEDVTLFSQLHGVNYAIESFVYDDADNRLTVLYGDLPEGSFTLRLHSGSNGFRDAGGTALDGSPGFPLPSGDGLPGGDFVVNFVVDAVSSEFPAPLADNLPIGSMIHEGFTFGWFHAGGDVDAFTLELDAEQKATLILYPVDASLTARLSFWGPDDELLRSADGSAPGRPVVLQNIATASMGSYRIDARSLAGSGYYMVQLVLNASVEEEGPLGISNSSTATAQSIASSAIPLQGSADRLAAIGLMDAGDTDFYTISLTAGQPATVVLSPQSSGQALGLTLGVRASDGSFRALASGVPDQDGKQRIGGFVPETDGEYFVRLTGTTGQYSLVVTRGAEFEQEPNFDPTTAQDISATGQALGALGQRHLGGGSRVAVLGTGGVSDDSGFIAIVNQLNDQTHFQFDARLVAPWEVDTVAELDAFDVVVIGNNGFSNGDGFNQIAPALRSWVETGGGVVMTGWGIFGAGTGTGAPVSDLNAVIPVNTAGNYGYFNAATITPLDTAHPIMAGVTAFTLDNNNYVEYPASIPQVDAGGTILATTNGQPTVVVGNPGAGRGVYLGPIYSGYSGYNNSGLRTGTADRLLEQAVAWAGSMDRDDYYVFQADVGDMLVLTTTTPGSGTGEPHSDLDPRLELYNDVGFLVGADDNSAADGRNARIVYTVPENGSGQYAVRVTGEGSGAYTLMITGATRQLDEAPAVTASIPAAGQHLPGPPATVTLILSEALLLDSVDASDLLIDGGAIVTGVELVDGRTLRFTVDVPDIEATYTYTLPAGVLSDLQGQTNIEHTGTFAIDHTGPHVVAQIPSLQASAPFTELKFIFNEPLDAASFTSADVVSFTGPGGVNLLGQISGIRVVGAEATVMFNAQTAQGTYTMTIGPNITDAVGNPMDQNRNGVAGEVADRYIATVNLQSPDLEVSSVVIPGSAQFGQSIDVTWTVRNIGSDPAAEGWSDRIYLSSDAVLSSNDVLLATIASPQVPLGVNQQYTQTASVTVPLSASLNADNYRILVVTDALSQQPESNEGNNLRASSALPISLPPLPDLVVSSIAAPVEAPPILATSPLATVTSTAARSRFLMESAGTITSSSVRTFTTLSMSSITNTIIFVPVRRR